MLSKLVIKVTLNAQNRLCFEVFESPNESICFHNKKAMKVICYNNSKNSKGGLILQ